MVSAIIEGGQVVRFIFERMTLRTFLLNSMSLNTMAILTLVESVRFQ